MVIGCHHGYYNYNSRSRARAAQLRRNVVPNNLTSSELQGMKDYDFCEGHHFMPYSSIGLSASGLKIINFRIAGYRRSSRLSIAPRSDCSWRRATDMLIWQSEGVLQLAQCWRWSTQVKIYIVFLLHLETTCLLKQSLMFYEIWPVF